MRQTRSDTIQRSKKSQRRQDTASTALSKDVLKVHNQSLKEDDHYAASVVKAEGMQSYYQAYHLQITQEGQDPQTPPSGFDQLPQIYQSTSSSATPMERFLMVSPTQDPHRPEARRALSDMGIGYGSLEHLETRSEAARSLAADVESPNKRAVSDGQVRSSTAINPTIFTKTWPNRAVAPKRRGSTPASEDRQEKRQRAS